MRGNTWRRPSGGRRGAGLCVSTFLVLSFTCCPFASLAEDQPKVVSEPKLLSVFPLGGRQGTTVQAEVRGNLLDGASAVWFDTGSLGGRVVKVEEVKEQSKIREKPNVLEK